MKRLNCPLCINTFGYSFGLECHLLSVHQTDLQSLREGKINMVRSHGCLCCAAQFLKMEILVRHILEEHKEFLLNSLHSREFSDFEDSHHSTQSLRRHFDCQFCGQRFLKRHQKLFLVHLEQRHLPDMELFMQESGMVLQNMGGNVENIEVKLLQNLSNKVRITSPSPPEHSKRRSLSAQRVKSDRIQDQADFLPVSTNYLTNAYETLKLSSPHHHYEVIASPQTNLTATMKRLKKKLRRSESTNNAESAIRKLPQYYKHTSLITRGTPAKINNNILSTRNIKLSTYKSEPQPEPPGSSETDDEKRTISTYSTNSSEESSQSSEKSLKNSSNYFSGNLFKCNLCEIAFAENAFLLTHLKNKHRSTVSKALKPHFSCGACPAKFFKNSFLVKHCELHGFDSAFQRMRQ